MALASGELVGVEALVRWRHPDEGLIYPDQFIGVAEANGLIDQLTHAVIVTGFRAGRAWRELDLAMQLSVNISTHSLTSLHFADTVTNLASASRVAPDAVMFEVTESGLIGNLARALEVSSRLRLRRFRLSIDDFGTGHSSLVQLRDIPFNELKIDHSFVHGASIDDKLRAIYGASLSLGQQLKLQVVAEGVENRADWDFVRDSGCDLAQGYFVARPMPAEHLVHWLADWKERLSAESLLGALPSGQSR